MGNTFERICKSDSYCLNNDIIKKETKESLFSNKSLKSRNKIKSNLNTFQINNVLSQEIHPIKTIKEENIDEKIILYNTSNNTFNSEIDLSNIIKEIDSIESEDLCITEKADIDIDIEPKKQPEKKEELKISKIDKKIFKKTLFNQKSVRSIRKFKRLLSSKIIPKEDKEEQENENVEENKNVVDENFIYEGEECKFTGELYKKDPLNGKGVLEFKNGKKLEGCFSDGKLNSYGKYTDEKGVLFEGDFKDGILEGKGKIIKLKENKNKSGSNDIICKLEYKGDIKNFKKEGEGEEICQDYIYKGRFHNDKKNGKGKIKYIQNGDEYEGDFLNDKITGTGRYIWNNKCVYEGGFLNGEMHGKGKFKWNDGSEYEGEYVNGIREGIGEFKWSNGNVFRGRFRQGKPDGRGLTTYNGDKFKAEFENGIFLRKVDGDIIKE